ncbi:hypothetical protein RRG08_004504 [Elysia crispata]|uniref:Peptidase M12B domain-containing protein n=1 Tax=Elysia crispata TaxID=231223 RepID=A0AAE1EC61_9GAST|nr:hypothetical protein RRG08_004504 [Elysia crispata]
MRLHLSILVSSFVLVLVVPIAYCDAKDNLQYVVEVLAVVDKSLFEKWNASIGVGSEENVLAEVKSLFFEVNILYQSLQRFNLSIEIRLKDVVFPSKSIVPDSAVKNRTVWERQVGGFFNKWLKANPQYTYDHAMILTNHAMKGNTRVNGVALTAATCRKDGTSRVRARLDYNTVITAAHEIGHSLGASHDNNKKKPCLKGYIMSPGPWVGSRNRFYFSECSAGSIRWYVSKRLGAGSRNCLLKTTSLPIVSKRMGEIFDVYKMCKRKGKWIGSATKGDEVCKVVKCRDRRWSEKHNPPEGISCGGGKYCYMGYCV